MSTIKYQVVHCKSLRIRSNPSKKAKTVAYLQEGEYVNCIRGESKRAEGIVWYKCNKGYLSSKYLKRITPNYLKRVSSYSDLVYNEIVKLGCNHKGSANSYNEIKSKKITTCASAVSAVLQLAGVLKKDTLINHTPKSDGKNKTTISKAISGVDNLISDTYIIVRVNTLYKNLQSAYKKKGVVLVYDSNIAIIADDGYIYSCNNGSSQLKDGKYIKNKMKSGYCFTSKILYVIVPKD